MSGNRKRKATPQEEGIAAETSKTFRSGVAAAIAGFFLFVLGIIVTPVRDWAIDLIPDRGRVSRIDGPDEVLVGKTFSIEPFIQPIGKLHHAVLRVKPSNNIKNVLRQQEYTLGKVAEESAFSKLYSRGALQFEALDPGEAEIACDLLSGDHSLDSSVPRKINIVRHHSYEGDWSIRIGETDGTMHLEEMPDARATVYGTYKLNTGIEGLVKGTFDGAKFSGFLTIGTAPSRFEILGDTMDRNGQIGVSGHALRYGVVEGRWEPVGGKLPLTITKTL